MVGQAEHGLVKIKMDLAETLDMDVVMEGIETAVQRSAAQTIGCEQG